MGKKTQRRKLERVAPSGAGSSSAPADNRWGWLGGRWPVWVVAALALAVYANTFQADFTLDDVPIIQENRLITSLDNIPAMFSNSYWSGAGSRFSSKTSLYRPLAMVSYTLNYAVHGLRPAGYHVTNVVLHALVSVLLFLLVREVLGDPRVGFMAGVLFAVHPIHTEAVAGIVGRAEIMALLGTLMCCLGYVYAEKSRRWVWLSVSVLGYFAGMLSKETGVIAPAVIILWEILLPNRRRLLRGQQQAIVAFASYTAAFVIYMTLRSQAAPTTEIHAGFVGVPAADRQLTALRVCLEYVGLLLAPIQLSADYWVGNVPIARSLLEPGVALALAVLLGGIALVVWSWKRQPGVCWGLGFFAIALLPVSSLPFPIGLMKAERILYSPSAGFLVALAALLPPLWAEAKFRAAAWTLVGLLIALYTGRTWLRNDDWHDNHALAIATLKVSPDSLVFNTIMSRWYRDQHRNEEARVYLLKALEARPDDPETLYNLGNCDLDEKHYDQAIAYYRRALGQDPKYGSALNNLGRALMESGRPAEAVEVFGRLRVVRPDDPAAYVNLISLHVQLKQTATALPIVEEALRRFPNVAAVQWNAGAVYELLGRAQDAKQAFARAAELDPSIRTTKEVQHSLN